MGVFAGAAAPAHARAKFGEQDPASKRRRNDLTQFSVFKGPLVVSPRSLGGLCGGAATGDHGNNSLAFVCPWALTHLLADGQVPQQGGEVILQHYESGIIGIVDAARIADLDAEISETRDL